MRELTALLSVTEQQKNVIAYLYILLFGKAAIPKIERLNRIFKGNYKHTNGYGSGTGAVAAVTMFVAYFNFLRPRSKLEGNVPILLPELNSAPNMPTSG